jgi:hypothetical protein
MSLKVRYNLMIEGRQRDALRRIKQRDGIPESEQIRRALDEWLERKGDSKRDRKRTSTRKRS